VRLSIQVGSFLQKSNAEKLAGQLKQSGYNPQIVLAGIGSKQWNIVRVGPYQDWEEATQIATLLSRDQATPAVIHPIR
jgi:cell division protein FtsN